MSYKIRLVLGPIGRRPRLALGQLQLCISAFTTSCGNITALDTTPAVAAGLEEKAWGLEQVLEMTQAYFQRKAAVSGLATSKSFVRCLIETHVFRQFTSGNYMPEMWQADHGDG